MDTEHFQHQAGSWNIDEIYDAINDRASKQSETINKPKAAALIATIIVIALSVSTFRSKLGEFVIYIENQLTRICSIDTTVFDNLLNKIEILSCIFLRRSKSDDQITEEGEEILRIPKTFKAGSKSTLANVALPVAKDFLRLSPVQTRVISNDVGIEPTFLQEDDYPESWLTYDPVKGLINRRLLNELQSRDQAEEAPKNPC